MAEPGTRKASGSENGEVRATAKRDRRTLGRTGTLLERGVDFERLRRERLEKVQVEMKSRDVGAAGGQDGVKLEDEVWVGPDGPAMISLYPYEEKLLS